MKKIKPIATNTVLFLFFVVHLACQVRDIFLKHFGTVRLNTRFKIKEERIFWGRGGGGCIRLLIFTLIPWFLGFVDPWVQSPYNVIHKFEKTLDKQNEPTMASAMPRNTDILPLTTGCGFFVLRCQQSALFYVGESLN